MNSIKAKKVGANITKVLSEIIVEEAKDSLLKTITITAAEVASDLSIAKIYFTSLSELEKDEIEKEVNEAASFLRTELAQKIDLRHTPALKFIYDESIEYGNKIEKILDQINREND